MQTVTQDWYGFLTPDDIFFNRVALTNINFFDFNCGPSLKVIRQNVAAWYYTLRIFAISALLVVLLYIGIRMAIGARVSDIRWQFLIESFLLSMIGGLIGVVVGILGSFLITVLAPTMTISISLFSIILALSFSGLVGVGFGYYPAYKASLLNPIDALRYE